MTGRRIDQTIAAVLAALLAFTPALTYAAGEEDDDDTAGRVSVAVFLLYDKELSRKAQADLMRGVERALKQNKRIAVKDKDILLAEFGGEVPSDAISEARALREGGEELLAQGRPKDAIDKLAAAEAAIENVLAFVKKNELADVQFLLGVAHVAAGEKKKARAVFVRLQVWRPAYVVDWERHAAALPAWEEAKKDIAKSGRGSLEVLSEPEGALAFVDGKYVGVTPTAADALPVGDHYVTLKLEGYQRRVVKSRVDSHYQELVTESLPKSEKYLLIEQALARARDALGDEAADTSMLDLRTFLFIDQAVFVRVSGGGAKVKIDAYLYDLRSKRRLSQVLGGKITVEDADGMKRTLDDVASSLYTGVAYDGKGVIARKKKPKQRDGGTPFYGTWWFWTGLVVVGAAVATPFVYDDIVGPSPPECPPATTCGQILLDF